MPKVTEEHRQAMRRRVQDAALACFKRNGFAGASMTDIVKEAGLSAGAIYVYYGSKDDLMIDVARRVMEPRVAVLEKAKRARKVTSPEVVIVELLDSILIDNPYFPVIVQVWGEASHDEAFASFTGMVFESLVEEFTAYLASYLHAERGMEQEAAYDRAAALVPGILAMIQGAVVQSIVFAESSRHRVRPGIENLLACIDF